ncbi:MAG TPA: phosphatase PAP2 family protein [Candidatus Dormibacteraeota bacterium]|nr:phosphatase PAP2 family protein [Candidatus Dormibacteraeota bacterium]
MSILFARLRNELRQGVLFVGWKGAAFCVALGAANYVASLGYDYLNHGPYRMFLRSPIDQALPVVPLFVVPYVSLQPFIYASLLVFLLFRARVFQSAVLSMIATFLVSYVFFAFLQTYVDRPVLTGNDVFTRMVRDVYAGDHPFNDFPSLHVSTSTIIAIHWWRFGRRFTWPLILWAALIAMSTVMVRQHYVADIAGGLVLAFATSLFFLRLIHTGTRAVGGVPPAPNAA